MKIDKNTWYQTVRKIKSDFSDGSLPYIDWINFATLTNEGKKLFAFSKMGMKHTDILMLKGSETNEKGRKEKN